MRILLVAPMFPPQRGVAPLRTHSFAAAWAAEGHAVTVLTTQKRPDQVGLLLPIDRFEVVELSYRGPWPLELLRRLDRPDPGLGREPGPDTGSPGLGAHPPADAGGSPRPGRTPRVSGGVGLRPSPASALIHRLLAPLRYLKSRTGVFSAVRQPDLTDGWVRPAIAWGKTHGPWDVIVSSGGPPAAHLAALGIKHAGRAQRWAADFRDLWTDNHIYAGLFPFTLMERRRERRVLAAADRLVTVSPGLAERLRAKSGKPVDVIYNGYDPDAFGRLPPEAVFPKDGRVRLVYTGTVYERGQDVSALCVAVAAEPRAALVVASDRPDVWLPAARRFGLADRLDFRGAVPRVEALRMQRDAGALILLDWYDPRHGVLTGKVFEYLMWPAPIWVVGGSPNSPAAALVKEAGRGLALGRDSERIRAAIRELAAGKGPALEPNRPFIAGLTRGEQARRLLRLLD